MRFPMIAVIDRKWNTYMTNMTKPMLASPLDWDKLRYPVLVSPKIDGIRCVVKGGMGMSRSWKPLPNMAFQKWVRENSILEHMDGEVVVGSPTAPNVYNASMSGLMSQSGVPPFTFLVFDYTEDLTDSYHLRRQKLQLLEGYVPEHVLLVPQCPCKNREELEEIEGAFLADGYEGVVVRSKAFTSRYKCGRSTANEGYLLKLKRYQDSEAIVLGTEELMHNDNEATIDVQGHTTRSSHKANQRPGNMLGALTCALFVNGKASGASFSIGTGFDRDQRIQYWAAREALLGKIVKFRHMPHGALEAPRHPVFLGWRDPIDM